MPRLKLGQRVVCRFDDGHEEPGEVRYQRMAPPTYTEPEAFSVVLDSQRSRWDYSGTMFAAECVRPEEATNA